MRLAVPLRALAVISLAAVVSACGTVRPPSGPDPGAAPPAPTYPAYETFDASEYTAAPPAAVEIVHDVPAVILEGRVVVPTEAGPPAPSAPQPTQVEGYRVQVFTSASRETAERVRAEAVAWWERAQRQAGAPEQMEALVAYLQPYYRVRLGAFGTREEAEAALGFVRQQYPEAFLVPDLVTVLR